MHVALLGTKQGLCCSDGGWSKKVSVWISSGVLSALKSVLIVSAPKIVHLSVLFLSLFLLWLGAASIGGLFLIPLANIWKIPMSFLNSTVRDLYRTTKWFDFFSPSISSGFILHNRAHSLMNFFHAQFCIPVLTATGCAMCMWSL